MIIKRVTYRASLAFALLLMCLQSRAQTVTLTGQLLTEDTLQPLPQVTITATSSTRTVGIVEATTGPDGRFSMTVTAGFPYRLCSAATSNYVDTCRFAKPVDVTASVNMSPVSMTAPVGTRMRVRIIDADGLIRSPQAAPLPPDPAESSVRGNRFWIFRHHAGIHLF